MKTVTKETACFPAGTRITTDKGLKRIEDIQVGDMVLSRHESGIGEQEFKPVIRTVVHHNKPIFELTYAIVKNSTKAYGLSDTSILNLSRKGKVFGAKATPNHPFWVKGQGWTNLEDLKKGQLLEMKEEGYQAYVILSCPEYQTNHADVKASLGFTSVTHLDQFADKNKKSQYTFQVYSENGDCTELLDGRSSYSPVHIEGKGEIYVTDNPRRDTVYNFEVADNHTYYIFDKLWVHNDNCGKTNLLL